MYENHQLMYQIVWSIMHEFWNIDLLTNLDPNVKLIRMFMVHHQIILDNQHYHDFTLYQSNR